MKLNSKRVWTLLTTAVVALVLTIGAAAQTLTVTGQGVRLRTGPSLYDGIITQLSRGTRVSYAGDTANGFTYVRYGSYYGWVASEYLSWNNSGGSNNYRKSASHPSVVTVTGNQVRIRYGAGFNYDIVRYSDGTPVYFYRGNNLSCYGQSGQWWKIYWNGGYYWISKQYAR